MNMNILGHYKKLWFFYFNRLKNDNYRALREYYAELLVDEVEKYITLEKKRVLDVGGARGEFCMVINEKRGCEVTNLDPSPYEHGAYSGDYVWHDTIVGSADNIPFDECKFDLVICRGVLEHIESGKQQKSLDEIYRVLRKKGICYLMIPPWYSFHGGHGMKPFHYFPFSAAKLLKNTFSKKNITADSYAEAGLFPITFSGALSMIGESGFRILETKDLHFRLHFLTRIPFLREVMVQSAVFILIKE